MAERDLLVFPNKVIDGAAMKRLISRFIDHFGMGYTSHILDQMKTLGFQQATATSISLGIDDLLTIPSKRWLVQDAEQQSWILEKHHHYGNVHAVEKLRQSIEIWYATSQYLRQEMNPNFRMTNPSNPVHLMSFSGARGTASQVHQLVGMRGLMSDPQGQMIDLPIQSNLREGLSLTEYIISCYGARKGVVDTAVRTSDAGYLTRRLVEVVQHIIVRRTDCGTIRGISVSPQKGMTRRILIQTLMGRVLAEDIYMGPRCIAARNQDIGIRLIRRFLTFRVQPIYIRTPFTCRSTSWICQLCYGRSPTHGDLVELGEAVGIIAGQSIGEPGTQLTLRTFHTGGVFTGGTAKHVRAPYNGKIQFNEDLVHPTRTRHGHPAFLCSIDLYVTIESPDILHNVNIPPKSLIFVQNDQYVEAEQVIAEIRVEASTLNWKERVRKHIPSESEGEMHWSTNAEPEYPYGNVHILSKTSHLWILAASTCRSGKVSFSLHKDQDQINAHFCSIEEKDISDSSMTKGWVRHQLSSSNPSDENKDGVLYYSRSEKILPKGQWNFLYPSIFQENSDFLGKSRRNRFLIPFQYQKNKFIPCFRISIKIPIHGILGRKNSIFAYCADPRYRIRSSGIIQSTPFPYSIRKRKRNSMLKKLNKGDFTEFQGIKGWNPKDERKIEQFCFIPEKKVHILPESSCIMVRNNSIIGVYRRITSTKISRVSGLVRVQKKKKWIELTIFSGNIHFPGETDKKRKRVKPSYKFLPPGTGKKNSKESPKWKKGIHVQWITLIKKIKNKSKKSKKKSKKIKKQSVLLVRPAVAWEITDKIHLATFFPQDPLQERENVPLKVVHAIPDNARVYYYGRIRRTFPRGFSFVRTCLVWNLGQEKKGFIEEVHASFVEIRTNGLIRDFLRMEFVQSSISHIVKRKKDTAGSGFFCHNGFNCTNINPFDSKAKIQSFIQHKETPGIGTLLNRNKECQSLLILPSSNCSRIGPFHGSKSHNITKEPMKRKKDLTIPIRNLLGPLGITVPKIMNLDSSYHFITHNQILLKKYLLLYNWKHTFQVLPYCLMDENGRIYNPDLRSNIIWNSLDWNWHFLHHDDFEESPPIMILGQFLCENVCFFQYGPQMKSGQVLIVHVDSSFVIRSAKPYLVTPGTTVHGHYGEILYKGNTLMTFLYEKSRSGDITQGLLKAEQVFEARSLDSISRKLKKRVEDWKKLIPRILGISWGSLIGAELTIAQSRISLVNQIQEVYRSQNVQIHNRHIEMIIRQVTSKVLVSSRGRMSNVFSPGERIGLLRAERARRALNQTIRYKAILLGITRASLNTQSFICEASFQETARILAKSALWGRIDWLKGLKENVVLGRIIPAGTGFQKLVHRSKQQRNIHLEIQKRNFFKGKIEDLFSIIENEFVQKNDEGSL